MVRIAIIGLGGMGFIHYSAYKNISGAKVVAVVDTRVELARERVADDSVAVYATSEELYASGGFDMVDICTPSFTHKAVSIDALERGYHVLSEKPMATDKADAMEILRAAEASGKFYMVAHVVRFMSAYAYLKSIVDSGELGAPKLVELKRYSEAPKWSGGNWMMDAKKSGGVALELCIHDIDYAMYLFGAPSSTSSVYRVAEDHNDFLLADLNYDGFTVRTSGGWFDTPIDFRAEFTAIFEGGYVDFIGGILKRCGEVVDLGIKNDEDTGINLSSLDGYADELEYFVGCIENGTPPTKVTPRGSYESIALADKLVREATIIN
jgi:predicted dehydrogenase